MLWVQAILQKLFFSIFNAVYLQTSGPSGSGVFIFRAAGGAVGGALRGALEEAVGGAFREAVGGALQGAVGGALREADGGAVGAAVGGAVAESHSPPGITLILMLVFSLLFPIRQQVTGTNTAAPRLEVLAHLHLPTSRPPSRPLLYKRL